MGAVKMALRARAKSSSASSALKRLREAAGLSVRQVASAISVPSATYYHYERGYEKAYLPPELIERLAPVLEKFGIDPVRVRALGQPTDEPSVRAGAQPEIARLPRPRWSPIERALIGKQLADWKNDRDFDQRRLLLNRMNLLARGVATTWALKYQCAAELEELAFEAEIGATSAFDRYDESSGRAFDDVVVECAEEKVRDHIQGLKGVPNWRSPFEWERAHFERLANDEAGAPPDYGERPIPIYKRILERVSFVPGGAGSGRLMEGWRRRPQNLLGLDNVYGLAPTYVVQWALKNDIVLLVPHSKGPLLDCNVMIAAGPDEERLGLELIFGVVTSSDDDKVEITKFGLRPHQRRIALRRDDIVAHKILRMTDVL